MTNYEKLTRAMPKQLAELLAKLLQNPDGIGDEYCKQCPIRDTKCPVEHDNPYDRDFSCPVKDEDIVLWWLNQLARESP